MGKPTVHTEALQRAAGALGEARLAVALDVPVEQIQRWISGEEYPPTAMYQKALDLLIGIGTR
jgi:DNA-binding transcriptional regulator YiaG